MLEINTPHDRGAELTLREKRAVSLMILESSCFCTKKDRVILLSMEP